MFKRIKKWIMYPDQDDTKRPVLQPLSFMTYGSWRPTARRIELEVITDCSHPYFYFSIVEEQVRQLDDGECIEILGRDVRIITIAFYPEYGSEIELVLLGLGDDGFRGNPEQLAVHRVFNYCMIEHYADMKKCISGHWKCDDNPFPVIFTEYWAWRQSLGVINGKTT